MNKVAIAESLKVELEARLVLMESLEAFVAAAHLQASLDALCKQFGLTQNQSKTE